MPNNQNPSLGRILVSLLWAGGGVAAFAAGQPVAGLVAVIYLAYLWLFGGSWLIY